MNNTIKNKVSLVYNFKDVEFYNKNYIINQLRNVCNNIILYLFENNIFITKDLMKKNIGISLIITNNKQISKINYKWRGLNKPTNVLSMGMFDLKKHDWKIFNDIMLGDIVISFEYAKKEAKRENIPVNEHIIRLFIHGFLHIIGFDHSNKDEAKKMYDLEDAILKKTSCNIRGLTSNYWL